MCVSWSWWQVNTSLSLKEICFGRQTRVLEVCVTLCVLFCILWQTVSLTEWFLLVTVSLNWVFLNIFSNHIYLFVCLCCECVCLPHARAHMRAHLLFAMYMWDLRPPFWCWVSPATVWVPGIQLRPAGLVASTCTCWLNFILNILYIVFLKVIYMTPY